VWNELEKENKQFFETYAQSQESKADDRIVGGRISQTIKKMIPDSSKDSNG
jgi:hypothetical protein